MSGTRVALVLVGDELLAGRRADGNGPWMARWLAEHGAQVRSLRACGDAPDDIAGAVRAAAAQADLVLVSGGLGPTPDDRTREGLSEAAGRDLVHHAGAWEATVAALEARGRAPGPGHRAQAALPEGAGWIANAVGVAVGIDLHVDGARVMAFPGVPAELQAMVAAHVPAFLAGDPPCGDRLLVAGLAEPEVAARVTPALADLAVTVGFYPHEGEVEVCWQARGPTASADASEALRRCRDVLGLDAYVPAPGERIEHVVVAGLRDAGWRVTTAESVTGGLMARMLTRVPQASAVLPIAWVPYATAEKVRRLGVPAETVARHGVVSAAVAGALAEGARREAGVEAALASTGAAGPGPWEADGHRVEAGTVFVALAVADEAPVVRSLHVPMPRPLVQRRAAVAGLDLLRRRLQQGKAGTLP